MTINILQILHTSTQLTLKSGNKMRASFAYVRTHINYAKMFISHFIECAIRCTKMMRKHCREKCPRL